MAPRALEPESRVDPPLRVTGRLRVIFVVNLGKRSFRGDPDRPDSSFQRYRRLRGTRDWARALRRISPSGDRFVRDDEHERVQRESYQAGVLTQYVLDHEFLPRYRLAPGVEPPDLLLGPGARRMILAGEGRGEGAWGRLLDRVQRLMPGDDRRGPRERLLELVEAEGRRRLREEWDAWPVKQIGWSRYGLLQIYLERPMTDVSLLDALQMSTSHERQLSLESLLRGVDGDAGDSIGETGAWEVRQAVNERLAAGSRVMERMPQLEVAAHVAELFLNDTGARIRAPGGSVDLRRDFRRSLHGDHDLKKGMRGKGAGGKRAAETTARGLLYPLRFRYVVFDVDHLETATPRPLTAPLEPWEKTAFSRLLSGAPVRFGPGDDDLSLPWTESERLAEVVRGDLSSWPSELCLLTGNTGVVCHPTPRPPSHALQLARALPCDDYWRTVIRCIEYGCELRTMAKLMEHETSDALEDASDCLFHMQGGRWSQERRSLRSRIDEVRLSSALASRIVARLRNVSMPTTVVRTDHMVRKMEAVHEVLRFGTITDHVEKNLDLIDQLLTHDESVLLQRRSTRLSLYLALGALVVSLVALPSATFAGGFRGLMERLFLLSSDTTQMLGSGLALLALVALGAAWLGRRR